MQELGGRQRVTAETKQPARGRRRHRTGATRLLAPLLVLAVVAGACGTEGEPDQNIVSFDQAADDAGGTDQNRDEEIAPAEDEDGEGGGDEAETADESIADSETDADGEDDADGGQEIVQATDQVWCAPAAAPATIGAQRTPGQITELLVTTSRSDGAGADSDTKAQVEVLSDDGESYDMLWTNETSLVGYESFPLAVQKQLEELGEQSNQIAIEYQVGPEGTAVTNAEEIRDQLVTAATSLTELIELLDLPAESEERQQVEFTIDFLAGVQADQVQLLFAQPTLLFHAFDGVLLEPGLQFAGPDILPNALGGEPFPSTFEFEVADQADDDGCLTASMVTTPDPDEFARITAESVKATLGTSLEADELLDNEVRNEIVARIDPSTAQVRSMVATQTITLGGESRTSTTSVRQSGF